MGLNEDESLEEKENTYLLDNTKLVRQNTLCTCWRNLVSAICGITYEPLAVIFLFVNEMYLILSKQFIYRYFAIEYGLNRTTEANSTSCNTESYIEAKVSAASSEWILYLNIAGFIPSLFTVVMIGAWGDVVGRRLPFLFGFFGYFFMVVVYLLAIGFNLSISYIIIGRIICGLCGDISVLYSTLFAYTSDISTSANRTLKFAITEGLGGIGGLLGSLISGIWVEKHGFFSPFLFSAILLFASMVYIYFILPESRNVKVLSIRDQTKILFSFDAFVEIKKNLFPELRHSLKILGMVICFLMRLIVLIGFVNLSTIYELSPPFCFSSLMIGYANSMKLCSLIFSFVLIKLLSRRISDYFICVIGIFSSLAMLLFYAFSTKQWMLFFGIGIGWFRGVQGTVIVSFTSKLANENSQGSVLALNSLSGSIGEILAVLIFNPIYSATVHWFPGFVFLVLSGFQVLVLIFFTFLYLKIRNDVVDGED